MDAPQRTSQRPLHRLTRRRVPLSCTACRVRKLKCNRDRPCQNCVVRGENVAAACTYAEKAEARNLAQPNPRSDAEDMRKRINRLESSILSIISKEEKQAKQFPSQDPHVTNGSQTIEVPSNQTGGQKMSIDTRSTHWDSILNDLEAMKDAWSEENDKIEFSNSFVPASPISHRPSLLSGLTPPPDRATVVSSIPAKDAADKLVSRFFDSYSPMVPAPYVLHKATFLKQYNNHWADPTKATIVWIGLFFSMLCIAMQSYERNNDVPLEYQGTSPAIADLYRVRAAQCLLIADLNKPVDLMVEALLVYSMAEYSDERDGDMRSWLLAGILIRLALQQGYHRDPSQHPSLSIFQSEMRRRVWTSVNQHELLFSVKAGLPKSIRYAECDTEMPRNLYEEELYEDMKQLPPSRPLTEPTPVSYQVIKSRIMCAYGNVVEFLHILEPQPYEEVLKLDLVLMKTREMIPPHLQLRDLRNMQDDPPSRIMERYILQLFYHKSVCILHRKYWHSTPTATPKSNFFYSRKTCVASAMALLDHQASMHRASQPGGIMRRMKWFHFSLTNHDFLLAAMIVCLDLMSRSNPQSGLPDCIIPDIEKINAIKGSKAIWTDVVGECKDARRAVDILTGVLRKLSARFEDKRILTTNINDIPISASATNPTADSLRFSPYFTDQFGLGIPLIADLPPADDIQMQGSFLDSLESDSNIPADFDWNAWDLYMASQETLGVEIPGEI